MKKIRNPFLETAGFHCFACSPTNPHGLHMEFWQEDDGVVVFWQPREHYQGWGDILHGGVQSTLIDEIASWAIFVTLKTAGVTYKLEMKFLKPVSVREEKLTIRARVKETRRNIAIVEGELYNSVGEKCTQGLVYYFTFPAQQAAEKLNYPGLEAFYENDEPVVG